MMRFEYITKLRADMPIQISSCWMLPVKVFLSFFLGVRDGCTRRDATLALFPLRWRQVKFPYSSFKKFFSFFLFTIFIYNIVAVVNKRWETLRVFGCLVSLRLLFSSLVDAQRERNLPFVVKEGRLKHKRIITGRRGNVLFFSPGRKEVNCHRKGHRVGIAPRDMIYPDSFLYNILKLSLGWLRSVTGWLLAFFFSYFYLPSRSSSHNLCRGLKWWMEIFLSFFLLLVI